MVYIKKIYYIYGLYNSSALFVSAVYRIWHFTVIQGPFLILVYFTRFLWDSIQCTIVIIQKHKFYQII